MPQRKQPRSEGQNVPEWLEALGIGSGEWQLKPKPWLRRVMVDESWPDKARVWACVSLHTFGYSSEVAVTMDRGKPRLLTRADVAKETGMAGNRVRRGLVALEADGWLRRQSASGKEDLERGDIEIHVYGTPKPAQSNPEALDAQEAPVASFPDGIPDELLRWLKRAKVHNLPAEKLERAKILAHEIAEGEKELLGLLRPPRERVRAKAPTGTARGPVKKSHGAARERNGGSAQAPSVDLHLISVLKLNENKVATATTESSRDRPKTLRSSSSYTRFTNHQKNRPRA